MDVRRRLALAYQRLWASFKTYSAAVDTDRGMRTAMAYRREQRIIEMVPYTTAVAA